MAQGIEKQTAALAAFETESHFVEIGLQVFGADLMPRSDDPALQKRECTFYRIGMHVAVNIDSAAVLDPLVLLWRNIGFSHGEGIGSKIIGHDHINIFADILPDVSGESSGLYILGVEEPQIATPLPESDHDFLVGAASAKLSAAPATAHIGFVHFDSTVQHGPICFFHGGTDTMAEIPCRFVRTPVDPPDRALQLQSAHALLGFAEQQYSSEPYSQRQVGIVEHRASGHGEVIFALGTVELLVGLNPRDTLAVAMRTLDASRPAQLDQNFPAFIIGVEKVLNVEERHG